MIIRSFTVYVRKMPHFVGVLLLFFAFVQTGTSFTFEEYRKTVVNSNDDCGKIFNSLDKATQFKFFDATGKIPVGFLEGHFNLYGAFDECLAIAIPEKDVLGKYCTAKIPISDISKLIPKDGYSLSDNLEHNLHAVHNISKLLHPILPVRKLKDGPMGGLAFSVGICIPHRCTKESLSINFDESSCATSESRNEMSTEARIALYIIIAFVIAAIISTIYDIVRVHYDRDPHHDVLIAFSLYSNGKKLCSTSKNPQQLLCLNGLKTLNMIWVIAGHTLASFAQGPIDNNFAMYSWIQDYSSMIIAGATVSVDSFFTIGGLLSVYTLLKSKDPGMESSIKSIPLLYLHRYLRLTPAFAIIILISWSNLTFYMADGPMWSVMTGNAEPCKEAWWSALLYIQNYRTATMCVGQSWYLSVDMQLFILSPLIWIPLRKWPELTLKIMFGLVALGIAVPFGIAFYYKLPATMIGFPTNDYMNVYYMKTHARFGTYIIGMIAGYYIYHAKQRKSNHINPVVLFGLWSSTIVVLYGCIYGGYPLVTKEAPALTGVPTDVDEATRWWNSIYVALNRPAWSTALAVLIYLCVTGHGGPVNWFLSTGPMQFLAKLSYCMYLNHIIFISLRVGQARHLFHFGNWELINVLVSIIMVIIPASIVQSLLFESPMICIEKIIFGKNKTPKKDANAMKNEP